MKFKALMCLLMVPLIFSGCAKKNTENLYLSIVTEPISQDVSGDEMSIYCYDFKTKEVKKVIDLDKDDFKNPVYSKNDNAIYYTKNSADSSYVDLYSMNVDTKESRQLTERMEIYSEIIPAKDEIYFASLTGNPNEYMGRKPCVYDKNTGKTKMFFQESNFTCEKMIFDPVSDHMYAGCVSSEVPTLENENDECYILDFYKDFENPQQLMKSNRKEIPFLVSTIPGEDELYLLLDDNDNTYGTPSFYSTKDKKYKNIDFCAEALFLNENEILIHGLSIQPLEIATYNYKTKDRNVLFTIEGQQLVSFKLLSK